MGSFLDKPKTEKTTEHGAGNDLHYGLSAMQGWRIEMEDSHSAVIGLPYPGLELWSFFAVFDGHAGGSVSKYSSTQLLESIISADPTLCSELAALFVNSSSSSSQKNAQTTSSSSSPNKSSNTNNSPTSSNSNKNDNSSNLNNSSLNTNDTNTTNTNDTSDTTAN